MAKLAVTIPADTVIIVEEDLAGCFAEVLTKATYHKYSDINGIYIELASRKPMIGILNDDEVVYLYEQPQATGEQS